MDTSAKVCGPVYTAEDLREKDATLGDKHLTGHIQCLLFVGVFVISFSICAQSTDSSCVRNRVREREKYIFLSSNQYWRGVATLT